MVTLEISRNQITSVEQLSNLTNLEELRIADNHITNLTPLANLSKLTLLFFSDNPVNRIDSLANLHNIRLLGMDNVGISDLSPLSGMSNLLDISAAGNQIIDLSPLSSLPIHSADLSLNQISNLLPFANENIVDLYLSGNDITDLSPLSSASNLEKLLLNMNQIKDLTPLSGLAKLEELQVLRNQISDVTPLATLTSLLLLNLSQNQIGDISSLAPVFGAHPGMSFVATDQVVTANYIGSNNGEFEEDNPIKGAVGTIVPDLESISDSGVYSLGTNQLKWSNLPDVGTVSFSWISEEVSSFVTGVNSGNPDFTGTFMQPYGELGASVTVQYVTENNQTLETVVIPGGPIGSPYTAEQKNFPGYQFKETIGDAMGTFSVEPRAVTFVYKKNLPPGTGDQ